VPILGTATQRQDAFREPADIYTCNYENLEWLIRTWNSHWPYGMVVIDEATKVKSLRANLRKNSEGTEWVQGQGGKRAKALLKCLYQHRADRIIELSGTPAPNGLQDLWGQAFLLDYGQRLGRVFDAFQSRWFRYSFDGFGLEPVPYAQEQIVTALQDLCLSLKSEDWFDVQKPIQRVIHVALPPDARKSYREMEKKMFAEIQQQPIEAFNAGARTQKLLQMASGAVYTGSPDDPGPRKWVELHAAKLDALEEIVEETAGAPLLVGYHFQSDLARILKRFPKAEHFSQKAGIQARWDAGKIPMLVAHPGSVGHGLNLQKGTNILVRFSSDWNHEHYAQILERVGPVRQAQAGFNRNVFEYKILATNTIDEDVEEDQATKCGVQESLMNGMRRRLCA
jgi:SNF2 family DNA or RNA helicase